MTDHTPGARLAKQLPPDGARRVLEVIQRMVDRGVDGEVARIVVLPGGKLRIVVQEVYSWRG